MFHHFSNPENIPIPDIFPSPFDTVPHPLAQYAAHLLQQSMLKRPEQFPEEADGKMFGVLVVKNNQGELGYLSAFSGMYQQQWHLAGFVPPIFGSKQLNPWYRQGQKKLDKLKQKIAALQQDTAFLQQQKQYQILTKQANNEITRQKQQNRVNKQQRDLLRQTLPENDPQWQQLARQSQQDKKRLKKIKADFRKKLALVETQLEDWHKKIEQIKKERQKLSLKLQKQLFDCYELQNIRGQKQLLKGFYPNNMPPSGSGDCAAPKLLQYANQHQFQPVALAEFWWGNMPSGEIRHHKHFYPACRSKCQPILPFMLQGTTLATASIETLAKNADKITILYEDDYLLVINKPEGLLSVPGKTTSQSVYQQIRQAYPQASGPLVVHRLDMATSGILLIAKNEKIHKHLQQQFIKRQIKKRYIAIVEGKLNTSEGEINLPLRTDFNDRPRQMVCYQYGKAAKTLWKVISKEKLGTRLYFYPITGRTHQLRIHAAHSQGLNRAIVGDRLYGQQAHPRLLLHAEQIRFQHPVNLKNMSIQSPCPF